MTVILIHDAITRLREFATQLEEDEAVTSPLYVAARSLNDVLTRFEMALRATGSPRT